MVLELLSLQNSMNFYISIENLIIYSLETLHFNFVIKYKILTKE